MSTSTESLPYQDRIMDINVASDEATAAYKASLIASKVLQKLKPSPLRISTLVATANTTSPINRDLLFEQIQNCLIPLGYPGEGILKMEYKAQVIGIANRDAFTNRKISKNTFFNQATVILRMRRSDTAFKEVNIKLFQNGGVQMTGIPSVEFAKTALQKLMDIIKSLPKNPFTNPSEAAISKFNIQLINSDYTIQYPVKRIDLHTLLTRTYGLFSTNESTIYQGVNTKYYYNTAYAHLEPKGVCHCESICTGKGDGNGDGQCKRVTLSVFQTGKIIITGARKIEQIVEVFHYFNDILAKHSDEILRIPSTPLTSSTHPTPSSA